MGNKKGLHWHHGSEFRNPLSITSFENLLPVGKSLNNQDLMFQSRNVEVSKSSSGVIVISTHTMIRQ